MICSRECFVTVARQHHYTCAMGLRCVTVAAYPYLFSTDGLCFLFVVYLLNSTRSRIFWSIFTGNNLRQISTVSLGNCFYFLHFACSDIKILQMTKFWINCCSRPNLNLMSSIAWEGSSSDQSVGNLRLLAWFAPCGAWLAPCGTLLAPYGAYQS